MSALDEMFNMLCKSVIPTLDMLEEWSFVTSIGKSTNKLKVDESIITTVEADAHAYKTTMESTDSIKPFSYRVKTPDSIRRKVTRHSDLRFQSIFNDILGIRVRVKDYNLDIPEYYRVVDLRNGKSEDDGYRAIHLYYKRDNFSYPIEVQLWSDEDYLFNLWMHLYGYKVIPSNILLKAKSLYNEGKLKSFKSYCEEVNSLWLK